MALPTLSVLNALRSTAERLSRPETQYSWAHQGNCNCGHLAQTLTRKSHAEIHADALRKAGDWSEHVIDYCPVGGLPIDHIITVMLETGFSRSDLIHLERLSDPQILSRIPFEKRNLRHNKREDVLLYFQTWIQLLEEQLGSLPQETLHNQPVFGPILQEAVTAL